MHRSWLRRNSSRWLEKGKDEISCTTRKDLDEADDYDDSIPSRSDSTVVMTQPERVASRQHEHRRSATARSILSQAATTRSLLSVEGASQSVIKGGGRQRWEQADGSGRWEGFGGVIKTIELEVSSEVATPTSTTGAGEFGRGLTRRDEWDIVVPSPIGSRSRAGSRVSSREDRGG